MNCHLHFDHCGGNPLLTGLWPGVWIVPTPGHTAGHQSLVVRRCDGSIVLAGQAHDGASGFAADELARRPGYRAFLDRLAEFDPRRVLFAHDNSVWEPV